ncbi:Protein CBG27585 [Caenorhabditis briggsae]|uniref:Protein CBG27585 n=1 Tax=Caenorhabditis briggsae TaxID=6238 RepID=B6IKF5_CAEBR|nr:Protein CBG27585 [Caenorhabditis briggsae]CAS00385.1 Protein CBG27585 [Caenorhabditis briggsae]
MENIAFFDNLENLQKKALLAMEKMKNLGENKIQNVIKEADSILMCPKEVFEAGVTLDVRTSKASIPQESTVRSENPIIFENQAHQDNVKYPLVEDEAPDESAGSETVESEISTTISLIKNSASASTEKTIPENPRTMEALTIPDASRIICSADMGGSEEDTIALAKQDLLILQNHKIQTSTLLCNGKWEDYRRCMKKCTKIHFKFQLPWFKALQPARPRQLMHHLLLIFP